MIISPVTILTPTYVSYHQSGEFVAWLIPDPSVRPPSQATLGGKGFKPRPSLRRSPPHPHVPPRGMGVPVCRSDPTLTATSSALTVAIDSTSACHGYGDALPQTLSGPASYQPPRRLRESSVTSTRRRWVDFCLAAYVAFPVFVLRLVPGSVRGAFFSHRKPEPDSDCA